MSQSEAEQPGRKCISMQHITDFRTDDNICWICSKYIAILQYL